MKLCPEPVAIVRAERITLAELRCTGVSGYNFSNLAIDCGQQFRYGLPLIAHGILCRCSFHLFHQSPELLVKQRVDI
jgi:hypothetical protein